MTGYPHRPLWLTALMFAGKLLAGVAVAISLIALGVVGSILIVYLLSLAAP